jgi:hypothetical protein
LAVLARLPGRRSPTTLNAMKTVPLRAPVYPIGEPESSRSSGPLSRWGSVVTLRSSMPGYPKNTRIVYGLGLLEHELIFVPLARAEELAAIQNALGVSPTWGELEKRLAACSEEAHKFIVELAEQYGADPGDAFESGEIGTIADGNWPPWPKQEMLSWVPEEIRQQFGDFQITSNGDTVTFYDDHEAEIVAALERAGFVVTRDDAVIANASGW